MDVELARKRLTERLADLEHSTRTLSAEGAGRSGDLSHIHQHPGDQGTDLMDFERENAVIDFAESERRQVQAALARIDEGTYGRCIDCGNPIPDERLEARPDVERCLADQQRYEASRT